MENQHRKISGYRELGQQEIDLMNKIKALGPQIEAVIIDVNNHLHQQMQNPSITEEDKQRIWDASPQRFVQLAENDLQTGLMYLTRAVAQPTFF